MADRVRYGAFIPEDFEQRMVKDMCYSSGVFIAVLDRIDHPG